jgi:hypothetical protein
LPRWMMHLPSQYYDRDLGFNIMVEAKAKDYHHYLGFAANVVFC